MYIPPFEITSKTINLIAEISSQIERYAIYLESIDRLHLRKTNKIKTIYSSLAIEGNNLTEEQVKDVIDGKTVIAPPKDIQEVKNAIDIYNKIETIDPYNIEDLLASHAIMMKALVDNPGKFRDGAVGVFDGDKTIHVAPPAKRVPYLMNDLFYWLINSKDNLLIKSAVFHYEFEFIHPFQDGNGRMGRLWQSVILGKLNPIFLHLPIENIVYDNQEEYYNAISISTKNGECGAFIEFMLDKICQTLKSNIAVKLAIKNIDFTESFTENFTGKLTSNQSKIMDYVKLNPYITQEELAKMIGITRRSIANNIKQLKDKGLITRIGSDKNGYWQIKEK